MEVPPALATSVCCGPRAQSQAWEELQRAAGSLSLTAQVSVSWGSTLQLPSPLSGHPGTAPSLLIESSEWVVFGDGWGPC